MVDAGQGSGDADCCGGEPVFRDGDYVGYVTSGAYGYTIGDSLALGYIKPGAYAPQAAIEVEINGVRRAGKIVPGPLHDPKGARMLG